jgi:pimeloyl-ACP methyl ester carboxylesterase
LTQSSLFVTARDKTRLFVRYRPDPLATDRPTAILCDGIACDGFIWKYLWDDLAKYANVVHWHYRGHGRSARPADPSAIELLDHAHDLDAVRQQTVGNGSVVLFGHSMGCQVALEGYRLRPENVRGLVLICGSSGRITHTFKGTDVMAQLLQRVIETVDKHIHIARGLWGHLPPEVALRVAMVTGEVDKSAIVPEDLLPYMKHMVDIDLPMFLRMLRSAGEHSARDLLPKIDVPVLVLGRDGSVDPDRAAEAAARHARDPHRAQRTGRGADRALLSVSDQPLARPCSLGSFRGRRGSAMRGAGTPMDLETVKGWIERRGYEVAVAGPALLQVRWSAAFATKKPLPPLFVQLTENWVLLSVLSVEISVSYALAGLPHALLSFNRTMPLAKFALNDRDEVVLCAELPTEALDEDELIGAIDTLKGGLEKYGDYGRKRSLRRPT